MTQTGIFQLWVCLLSPSQASCLQGQTWRLLGHRHGTGSKHTCRVTEWEEGREGGLGSVSVDAKAEGSVIPPNSFQMDGGWGQG